MFTLFMHFVLHWSLRLFKTDYEKIIDKLLSGETDFKKVTDSLLYPIHCTVCLSHVLFLVVMLHVQYCEINIV